MLNTSMYLLNDGKKHYIEPGSLKGSWVWQNDDGARYLIATQNKLRPGIELYEDKPEPPTCNVCGNEPATYRITDYGRTHDEPQVEITYCCQTCLPRWGFVVEQLARVYSFSVAIAPIKDYGYRCVECERRATDVVYTYWPPDAPDRPADGNIDLKMVCDKHFLHYYASTLLPTRDKTGMVRKLMPIEDFLQEGMRWPGK